MGAVLLIFRSELRRRWRSWLILVLLIAVVGGLVLAAAAAGRRTASAFPRFVAAHGYDVYIFNDRPIPGLAKLPAVASVTSVVLPGGGQPTCACSHSIDPSNFYINELTPTALGRVVKLVAGTMPDPSAPNDVLASFTLQKDYGIHVGSSLRVPFYAPSQRAALNGNGNVAPLGPTLTLRVVGIVAAEVEFPSGQAPEYDLFTTPAFARSVNHRTLEASVYFVRLRSRDRRSSPIRRRHQSSPCHLRVKPGHIGAGRGPVNPPPGSGLVDFGRTYRSRRPGRCRAGTGTPEHRGERGVPQTRSPGLATSLPHCVGHGKKSRGGDS